MVNITYIDSINILNNYFIYSIISTLFPSCLILLDHVEEKMRLREEKKSRLKKTKSFSPIHKSLRQSLYNFVIAFPVFTSNDFLLPLVGMNQD